MVIVHLCSSSSYLFIYMCLWCAFVSIGRCTEDLHLQLQRQSCSDANGQCQTDNISDCVDSICQNCGAIYPEIAQCCAGPDDEAIAECIVKAFEGPLPTTGGQLTQSAPSSTRPTSVPPSLQTNGANLDACDQFESVVQQCDNATPGFQDLKGFASKAPCLCYSSSSYIGSSYDGYFSSCLDYFTTADPAGYSSIFASANGTITSNPCAAQLSISGTPVSATPASSGSTSSDQGGQGGFLTHPASPSQTVPPQTASSTQSGTSASVSPNQIGAASKLKVSNEIRNRELPHLLITIAESTMPLYAVDFRDLFGRWVLVEELGGPDWFGS